MHPLITLLFCVLAAARLTQLVHADRITRPLRGHLVYFVAKRNNMHLWLENAGGSFKMWLEDPDNAIAFLRQKGLDTMGLYWIGCTWCISIPAAVIPAAVWVWWRDVPAAQYTMAILAFSLVTVIVLDLQKIVYFKRVMYTPQDAEERVH